jgi:hypothetical protein
MPASVVQGIAYPPLNVQISSLRTDMTTVTAVTLTVRLADDTLVSWPATIDPTKTTKTYLEVNHTWSQPGDTPQLGAYHVSPQLTTTGGGPISCTPDTLLVTSNAP